MTLMAHLRWGMLTVLLCAVGTFAGDKKDPKPPAVQMVDSGSFGVFVRGQRVVTESFSVQQDNGVSIVKSHLQETANSTGPGQKSDLQMTGSGELVRYDWSDGNSSLVVTPKDEFLLERITTGSSSKPAEQPFLMPNTSAILDNNFFIHREVLAWRYLATNCHTDNGTLKCQQGPVEFGVLVPQDRTSMRVRMELGAREKVTIRGTERELLRLNLKGENFSWALWVDDKDHFKLMRVQIADDNTEVVRD
ncbi:MAG: hypothetical protein ABSH02_05960 [Candidatus Sulfotelmatobacter sp.]